MRACFLLPMFLALFGLAGTALSAHCCSTCKLRTTMHISNFSARYRYLYELPSVLWRCWLGSRKGIQPVKKLSGGVLAWLSDWSNVQTCILVWLSWCHCHSLSLASVKSRLVLPFWYWLTRIVPDKGLLNGCVCVYRYLYESFIRHSILHAVLNLNEMCINRACKIPPCVYAIIWICLHAYRACFSAVVLCS